MEPLLEEREHNQLNTRYPTGVKKLRGSSGSDSREIPNHSLEFDENDERSAAFIESATLKENRNIGCDKI